jgi:hypothetical protein
MRANECIEVVRYLNPRISRAYLEGLSHEQLRAYVVHLRALRLMRINDSMHLSGQETQRLRWQSQAAPQAVAAGAVSPAPA